MAQTVSYDSAMASLQSMFSGVDNEVIAMLLQANGGHLEKTVEQLLGITGQGGDSGPSAGGGGSGLQVPSSSTRRRSSNSEPVGGSNLPDDFLRPPSYWKPRAAERRGSAAEQIDQDAILAQMLQDEMFMADIRANPEFYYPDDSPSHPPLPAGAHPSPAHPSSGPSPASASSSSSYPSSASAGYVHQHTGSRGDFSGVGGSPSAHASSASFREKFNSLTSAAKKRLLTVATRLKPEPGASGAAKKEYNTERQDLASGLLSDEAGSAESSSLGVGGRRSSERVTERDVEPVALSGRVEDGPVDDGVYTQEEDGEGTGSGYVPPSSGTGDLKVTKKIWGRHTASDD